MRLLLVDPHSMFGWLVQELVPRGVTVESVKTLADASQALSQHPVDLAMFGLTATPLQWETLEAICRRRDPPIPIMYYSSVHRTPKEAGMPQLRAEDFFQIPISGAELREKLARFVAPKLAVGGAADGLEAAAERAEAVTPPPANPTARA